MAQFAFSATDRAGNTVEGNVAAADMTLAADRIREMGYMPVMVQLIGGAGADVTPTLAMSAVSTTATAVRPAVFDLTQTVNEYPESADALLIPPSYAGGIEPEIVQPWERGGRLTAQSSAPLLDATLEITPMTASSSSGRGAAEQHRTPAVPTAGSPGIPGEQAPQMALRPGAIRDRTPSAGAIRQSGVFERFKEVFIYPIRSGVVVQHLAAFYRQFATMIDAGLPIYQAIVALEANTQNSKLKEIARAGQAHVQAGGRFSDVMTANPWIFPPMQIQMIRAAEQGGMLDEMLRDVAGYVEHELKMKRMINAETLYPKLVLFMALMILGKPGIIEATPAFSKLIIASMGKLEYTLNDYLADTVGFAMIWLGPIFAAVVIFRLFLFNKPGVREAYDTFKTNIPGLGGLIRMFVVAKFMRVYASLYRAGFGMTSILQIAGDACGNVLMRNAAQSAIPRVERGGLVSEALAGSGFLPPMALDMFRTGETTGGMDILLSKMADHYEEEAKSKAHQMALIFSTCVFLLVAILVGMAVIRFYMAYSGAVSAAG